MIDKDKIRLLLKEKPWIISAGYLMVYVVVLALFSIIMIAGVSRKMSREKNELSALKGISEKYKGFDVFKEELEVQRTKFKTIYAVFEPNLKTDERNTQDYLEEISNICRQSNLNPDKLNPVNENGKQGWNIKLTADFKRLNAFVNATEKIFRIERISLLRSDSKETNTLDITVTAIPAPISVQSVKAGKQQSKVGLYQLNNSLFELSDKTKAMIEKTESSLNEAGAGSGGLRDPLNLFVSAVAKKEMIYVAAPEVSIEGIMWDENNPLVVIGGQVLKVGESIKGVKVTGIQESSINVEYRGHAFKLKLNK